MIEDVHGDLVLLRFERLSAENGVAHAVTTRPHNYAPHRGCGREEAVAWRQRVCRILRLEFECLTSPAQVHGAEILRVERADMGRGRDGRASAVPYVDGLITDQPGIPLILLSADCPLVWVYDPKRPAVGAVHASWQGTVARASENLVRQMRRAFGSEPSSLLAGIAPSAGPCCYEVGAEIRRIAETRLGNLERCFAQRDGRLFFDLWTANLHQLTESGILPEHVELAGLCTICDRRFWSHRRDGAEAGRFALILALRE